MTDLTIDVTVKIHGSEIDLVAVAMEFCPAEPDVGLMNNSIGDWMLQFQDGTEVPATLYDAVSPKEKYGIEESLNDALTRGDFE